MEQLELSSLNSYEIFKKTFEMMPNRFTGLQFSKMCRKFGIDESYLRGRNTKFLHKYAKNDFRNSSLWTKKTLVSNRDFVKNESIAVNTKNENDNLTLEDIKRAISVLEKIGLKSI